jgi:hypothetical protein
MSRCDLISQSVNCEYQVLTAVTVKMTVFWDVTCQLIAGQRLDKHPAIRARNSRTNVYSALLGNSAPMDWRDNYHVTCFLCGLR